MDHIFQIHAESSSSQLHQQQEDCQPRVSIGRVETNTLALASLAVTTASSHRGKDTSQAECDHASQPSHSGKESETGKLTIQLTKTLCCTNISIRSHVSALPNSLTCRWGEGSRVRKSY